MLHYFIDYEKLVDDEDDVVVDTPEEEILVDWGYFVILDPTWFVVGNSSVVEYLVEMELVHYYY